VRAVRRRDRFRDFLRKGVIPVFDIILGAATALGLSGYLILVLIRPERF